MTRGVPGPSCYAWIHQDKVGVVVVQDEALLGASDRYGREAAWDIHGDPS